ncbi:MAG: TRAP transporter large permease subunit, partial [Kiloniellales bacterium]|nr:TRAP transporter large permease subunit [Kiloniellales bacterium]
MVESLLGFAALLLLILLRMPIAFAMALVGFLGFGLLRGWDAAFAMAGRTAFDSGLSYSLSVVPLFILMGNLVTQAGLSRELYEATYALLGRFRGGLAMASVAACGGFSAVCGSSLATAATMSKVAMPSMRRYGYADSLAAGSIAAGGTLGILIPPSVLMVIYGIMTETDIAKLFIAGIVPGVLGVGFYAAAIAVVTRMKPALGPRGERFGLGATLRALTGAWGVTLLFAVIMGGIYGGVFTPTEAAGIGAALAFGFALLKGRLSVKALFPLLLESARTTAMIFMVLIGALIFT